MSATEIPGYKIIRTLGVGGQATVYLAIQQGFDREVALKVMSPALAADPTFGERFIREAKIVAKLSHKSIVTVYDVGESGNFYYLAMEYLPGGDLKRRIEQGVKTRECLTIIGKLAIALHFAHEKGYIHRDVKSENILFNEDGEPLLTDFGIAKASNSSTQMTQTGKLIGTPEYMSPEQCRGKKVDGRSDLYSLGVILFEMLTRHVPYTGEDSVAVCIKHVTKPLPQLPARLKHIQWLLDSLLSKDPNKRFQTGSELAAAVQNFGKTGKQQVIPKSKAQTQVSKPVKEPDEFEAFAEDEDEGDFDDLHTEKRYQITELEEKSPVPKIVGFILIGVLVAGGFLTRDKWYDKTHQWVAQNILGDKPATQSSNQVRKPGLLKDADQEQNEKVAPGATQTENSQAESENQLQEAPTAADLLQEADALVQFVPQKIEDIKKALKLVATVRTLDPSNKNAQLIYQNILSTSLMEATAKAEKSDFASADQWLALVKYEQPDYALLSATHDNIQRLRTTYDSTEQDRKQKSDRVSRLLVSGQAALSENRLSAPPHDNAIKHFQDVLKIDAENSEANQGLQDVASAYEVLIEKAIKDRTYSKAKAFLSRYSNLSDDQAKKISLRQKITQGEKAHSADIERRRQQAEQKEKARLAEVERQEKLDDPMVQMRLLGSLDSARSLEASESFVMPEGNNAAAKYRSVLEIDGRNEEAKAGLKRVEDSIIERLTNAVAASDKTSANNWLTQLKLFQDNHPQFNSFQTAVSEIIEPMPVESQNALPDDSNNTTLGSPDIEGANEGTIQSGDNLGDSLNDALNATQSDTLKSEGLESEGLQTDEQTINAESADAETVETNDTQAATETDNQPVDDSAGEQADETAADKTPVEENKQTEVDPPSQ